MDKNEALRVAKRYVGSISNTFQIESAILFGSFAKENYHPDSDIDIAFVVSSVDDIIDLQIQLMQMRTDDDLLIEPHPFKISDFNISNPVVAEIKKHGIDISTYLA